MKANAFARCHYRCIVLINCMPDDVIPGPICSQLYYIFICVIIRI